MLWGREIILYYYPHIIKQMLADNKDKAYTKHNIEF